MLNWKTMQDGAKRVRIDIPFPGQTGYVKEDKSDIDIYIGGGGGHESTGVPNGWVNVKLAKKNNEYFMREKNIQKTDGAVSSIIYKEDSNLLVGIDNRIYKATPDITQKDQKLTSEFVVEQDKDKVKEDNYIISLAEYQHNIYIHMSKGLLILMGEKVPVIEKKVISFDVYEEYIVMATEKKIFAFTKYENKINVDRIEINIKEGWEVKKVLLGRKKSKNRLYAIRYNKTKHEGYIDIYKCETGVVLGKYRTNISYPCVYAGFSSCGEMFGLSFSDGSMTIYTYDLWTMHEYKEYQSLALTWLGFTKDSKFVVSTGLDSTIDILELKPRTKAKYIVEQIMVYLSILIFIAVLAISIFIGIRKKNMEIWNLKERGYNIYKETKDKGHLIYEKTMRQGESFYQDTVKKGSHLYKETVRKGSKLCNKTKEKGNEIYSEAVKKGKKIFGQNKRKIEKNEN